MSTPASSSGPPGPRSSSAPSGNGRRRRRIHARSVGARRGTDRCDLVGGAQLAAGRELLLNDTPIVHRDPDVGPEVVADHAPTLAGGAQAKDAGRGGAGGS